ncbi:MAG TPA: hypothetical protein VEC02_00145 [Nitrososphaerales archaeon]|nr:hypothetical protein [Nitrososphaerales archaeon]
MNLRDGPTVQWLLRSTEPSVRYLTMTELLDGRTDSPEVKNTRKLIPTGPRVRALFKGQRGDGGFGGHPYQKWTGAHWRLVSLVELGITGENRHAVSATEPVLKWLLSESHLKNVPRINGLYRRCASQEGNALAVCSRLGMAGDPRVVRLAESLVEWQWPDGGWNCDRREEAWHSSFNESLSTLWGLTEFHRAGGDAGSLRAARKASEFFLKHRLFRSCRTGEVRPPETFHSLVYRAVHPWTALHYPLYWHYDVLQALLVLSRAGTLHDPRTKDALDLVEAKRGHDGSWRPEAYYWALQRKPTKKKVSNLDVVDWGRSGPNEFMTLNALRVLKAAGRF